MNKALAVAAILYRMFRTHPTIAMGAASLGAMLLALLGFNVSADQLAAIAGTLATASAAIVWVLVSPTSKLDQKGIAPKGSDSAIGGAKSVRDSSQGGKAPGSPTAGSGG